MYQDNTPSPASSSDIDPKARLKMKIQQMIDQRRGGKTMLSPASVSTSASSKGALPPPLAHSVAESDADIAKMEDVAHADDDDDDDDDGGATQASSEAVSTFSHRPQSRPPVSPLGQMKGLLPATYKAPLPRPTSESTSALGQMKGMLAILSVIVYS